MWRRLRRIKNLWSIDLLLQVKMHLAALCLTCILQQLAGSFDLAVLSSTKVLNSNFTQWRAKLESPFALLLFVVEPTHLLFPGLEDIFILSSSSPPPPSWLKLKMTAFCFVLQTGLSGEWLLVYSARIPWAPRRKTTHSPLHEQVCRPNQSALLCCPSECCQA